MTTVVSERAAPASGQAARRTAIARAVYGLALLGVALRAWVVGAGWFYWDDYIFQGRAWRLPLDADYLLYAHDGHFMPAAFLLQWPLTQHWPMDYRPLALIMIGGQALVALLTARLCLHLWPGRRLAAVPVALVAISPLTLTSNTWWAAALNSIPLQLAMVIVLLAVVRAVRTGRRGGLWLALALWVPLLGFGEKALVVPWAALAAVPVLLPSQPARAAWRGFLRRTWAVWAVWAVLSAGYVAAYLAVVGKTPSAQGSAQQVAELVGRGAATTVASAAAGGPLVWAPIGFGTAVGDPPTWLVVVAVELSLVLIIASCLVSAAARRAWIWAGLYIVGDLALLAGGRLAPQIDPAVVQGLRYTADAALPVALATGFALAGLAPRMLALLGRVRSVQASEAGRTALVVGTTALVVASAVSTAAFREIWAANDSRVFVETATAELAQVAEGPTLVDQPVPFNVLYPLAYPYNQASWLLGPVQIRPEFRDPTTQLRIFDESGQLRAALVEGPSARPGPQPGCGWLVDGDTRISLESLIIPFTHTVRVGYLAGADGSAALAIGDGTARAFDVQKGLHEVVITLTGGGADLVVSDVSPGLTLCIDDVRIGKPVIPEPS